MNELTALFAACHRTPDDDVARLVLADWLDEHDRPAQAELLRVQVELAKPCPHGYSDAYHVDESCPACDPIYARESALLRDEAALRWGVLAERKVEWQHKLRREWYKHAVTWVRGLPCVRCTLAELGREEVAMHVRDGRYFRPSPFAIAAACESGASFGVSDREPAFGLRSRKYRWNLAVESLPLHGHPDWLPRRLWEELLSSGEEISDTAELAHAALDRLITRLVHRAAYPQAAPLCERKETP